MLILSNVKLYKVKQVYLLVLLIGLILRSINVYSLLPSKYDSLLFAFLAVFGGLLLTIDFIINVKSRKRPYDILLIIFLVVLLISTIVNRHFGIVSNLKLMVWSCIYFFIVYEFGEISSQDNHFFKRINYSLIISWFFVSLLSLGMFLLQFGYEKYTSPRDRIRVGFLESRLFGLFGDPNYGAVICLVVIILSIFYLISEWRKKGIIKKVFLISNIIIQFPTLLLSGSRSALLISFAILGVTTFIYGSLFIGQHFSKNIIVKMVCTSIFTLIVLGAYFVFQTETKGIFQKIPEHVKYEMRFENRKNELQVVKKGNKVKQVKEEVSLVRKDVAQNTDISNMRFSIWKSAIEVFKTTSFVGTSPRNLIPYAKEKLPNTFIAEQSFVAHNTFINVLVSTGCFGFLAFIIFLVLRGTTAVIFYFKNIKTLPYSYYVYLSSTVALVLSGLFVNELVLVNTIGTFIFWLYLGKINGYMKGKSKWQNEK